MVQKGARVRGTLAFLSGARLTAIMIERVTIRNIFYHEDPAGWLLKAVPKEFVGDRPFGEIYFSGAAPGETRGRHYHEETTEWFCVIQGTGILHLQDIETCEVMTIEMSREKRMTVEIPPGVAHAIRNSGSGEMVLLAFADVPYDSDNPDTVAWDFDRIVK